MLWPAVIQVDWLIKFSFRQAEKSIYEYAVETKDPNIVSILIKAGCCRQNESAYWSLTEVWLWDNGPN